MASNTSTEKVAGKARDGGAGSREHSRVVAEVLALVGARADCRLWSNNSGVARALTHDGIIHFGLKGSSDLLGLTSDGRMLCLEVKTGAAVRSKAQVAFGAMIARFCGRYAVVRSGQDAKVFLDALNLPQKTVS